MSNYTDNLEYSLAKRVPDMARGFTIHTNYGDIMIEADQAPAIMERVREALQIELGEGDVIIPSPSTSPARREGINELRPEVLAFAQLMELRLREKDADKGSAWKEKSERDLLVDAMSKSLLLDSAVREGYESRVRHAVDLANCCMMIADVAGAIDSIDRVVA